ncbi:helix-turn-helix domain-containing protein [Myxococcus sp. K15C18031901]|uniref:helix-turn-helix transcriptional regulator n=1 Tax=Myxococcus dinghuensis TaxID=2906761 RepID=UPI0020A7FA67|nr:helix-turn-helix domain-containing protein [Myxococcus dinghuensis]MCP3102558.1 helix-turn-helix domain-containing protein [Myxococcus dinghuensis]
MKTELGIHLGQSARTARRSLGMTQAEVAEKLGVAREVYARLERGHMLPSIYTLRSLCTVLRVPPHDLLALDAAIETPPGRKRPPPRIRPEPPVLLDLRKTLRGLSASDLRLLNALAVTLPASPSRQHAGSED